MAGARKEVRGGAARLTLASGISAVSASMSATGSVTGWPTGASWMFEVVVDRNTPSEEQMLCSALSGSGPATITINQRGWNGTTAVTHDTNATVEHFVGADTIDDILDHVYDATRNDHTQYTKKDGSVAFTGVTAITATPVAIGLTNAAGTATTLSRSDHVHARGIEVPFICTSSTRPGSPSEGMRIYETDTDLVYIYSGSAWITDAYYARSWTVIGEVTRGSNGAISFASIPAFYTSLMLAGTIRSAASVLDTGVGIGLRFNGDTTANYDFNIHHDENGIPGHTSGTAQTSAGFDSHGANGTHLATKATTFDIVIPNYSSTVFHKGFVARSGFYSDTEYAYSANAFGSWRNTAIIDAVDFWERATGANNWATGSKVQLLAIR